MSLSSDWFAGRWDAIELSVDDVAEECVRQGCRGIVRDMIAGAKQYYHVDFSPERIDRTKVNFRRLLQRCTLSLAAVERAIAIATRDDSLEIDEGTRWLIFMITEQVARKSLPQGAELGLAIRTTTQNIAGESTSRIRPRFKDACLSSRTEWDVYLRSLTPALPESLANYVSSIGDHDSFEFIWSEVRARFDERQRAEVMAWYKRAGELLTGEPFRLPTIH